MGNGLPEAVVVVLLLVVLLVVFALPPPPPPPPPLEFKGLPEGNPFPLEGLLFPVDIGLTLTVSFSYSPLIPPLGVCGLPSALGGGRGLPFWLPVRGDKPVLGDKPVRGDMPVLGDMRTLGEMVLLLFGIWSSVGRPSGFGRIFVEGDILPLTIAGLDCDVTEMFVITEFSSSEESIVVSWFGGLVGSESERRRGIFKTGRGGEGNKYGDSCLFISFI